MRIQNNKIKIGGGPYIKFLHDCLLINKILVIGDLHIGYDEQIGGRAVFPKLQLGEIIEKLNGVFSFLKKQKIVVEKIVLLGDVKHDFGTITDVEWRETLEFFDYLKEKLEDTTKISNLIIKKGVNKEVLYKNQLFVNGSKIDNKNDKNKLKDKIIVIRGNHDNILKPISRKAGFKLVDYYCIKINGRKICFLHGNKLFKQCLDSPTNKDRDILVFGHLHPAITLYDNYKSEKYKCFLKGDWKISGKRKIGYVLPSFSNISFGYDLKDIDNLSNIERIDRGRSIFTLSDRIKSKIKLVNKFEFIKKSGGGFYKIKKNKNKFFVVPTKTLKNFEVIIYNDKEDKEYNFGRLKGLI